VHHLFLFRLILSQLPARIVDKVVLGRISFLGKRKGTKNKPRAPSRHSSQQQTEERWQKEDVYRAKQTTCILQKNARGTLQKPKLFHHCLINVQSTNKM